MTPSNARLLAELDETTAALRLLIPQLGLIGGLAIHLRLGPATDDEADELLFLRPTDPLRLAAAVRVTKDIDLAVPRKHMPDAVERLQQIGFALDDSMNPPPLRLRRRTAIVDLIAHAASAAEQVEGELDHALLWLSAELVPMPQRPVPLPIAALVALKSLACHHRHQDKDAIDLQRLALYDLERGEICERLVELWPSAPSPVRTALRTTRQRLGRSGSGVVPLLGVAQQSIVALAFDEDLADAVRRMTLRAVHQLLACVEES